MAKTSHYSRAGGWRSLCRAERKWGRVRVTTDVNDVTCQTCLAFLAQLSVDQLRWGLWSVMLQDEK